MRRLIAVFGALVVAGCSSDPCRTGLDLTPINGRIRAHFTVDDAEPGADWMLVVVHEGHVAWRGNGRPGPFMIDDYEGADHVLIRATGPNGRICTAEKTISAEN
jgi:hypothetical protein